MSRQILLVGLESSVTGGLGMVAGMEASDEALIQTGNAAQALDFVDQGMADAVLTGPQLPDMSGARLLDEVFRRNQRVHRFLVVHPLRGDLPGGLASAAHFILHEPLTVQRLNEALSRADQLTEWFGAGFVRQILSRLRKIPSPPAIYYQLLAELDSPAASQENLALTILQMPQLATKFLEVANSPSLQLPHPMGTVAEAVRFLGMEASTQLVLAAHLCCQFHRISPYPFSMDTLCHHSLLTARLTRALARVERLEADVQDRAFLAGLIHDIGKLVLAANAPEAYGRIHAESKFGYRSFTEVEREAMGVTHAEVGAWLAGVWGLPMDVVASLAFHHEPRKLEGRGQLTVPQMVYIANVLVHQVQQDSFAERPPQLDSRLVLHQSWAARTEAWRRLAFNLVPQMEETDFLPRSVAA